jgi:peptidoglycan hydrolase-like protein with peptidoglycan-binding domain
LSRRTLIALGASAAAVAAIVVVLGGGDTGASDGTAGSSIATSLATVTRRSLSSRTQVGATLGYADPATVVMPAGTATSYGQSSTYTELPAVGQIVRRGRMLLEIGAQPVVLLYGKFAPWRAFMAGMSPGRDVAELNANLRALGYLRDLPDSTFTAATAAAIDAFQAAHGLGPTGELLLGSVVFEPGPVRVTSVTPTAGAAVQVGPVLSITSTVRQVTIALDAAQQSEVKLGDPVTITLPDNRTTRGRVASVGTVATVPSSADQGGSRTPTIEVDVKPTHPAATGHLDQAPVNVSITTARVRDALVVPVGALLALAPRGYAVEEVGAGGVHRLVAVDLGLFDDADGLVQITGAGIRAGQRVVVPAS